MTHPLDALLLGRAAPGVWSIASIPDDVERHVASFGWEPMLIEPSALGETALDKPTFLAHVAQVARFPDWVGNNWDAFEDAMTDLSWLEDGPVIVIVAAAVPAMALDILTEVALTWERRGRRFALVEVSADSNRSSLDELYELDELFREDENDGHQNDGHQS